MDINAKCKSKNEKLFNIRLFTFLVFNCLKRVDTTKGKTAHPSSLLFLQAAHLRVMHHWNRK